MSETKPIRIALVGIGGIALAYEEAFAKAPRAQLCAVIDTDSKRADEAAARTRTVGYSSLEDLLKSGTDCDAIILCTPPNTHCALTCQAIEAGLHVLCEKPLSIDSHSAEKMKATSERTGKVLTMASKFRYVDDVAKSKEMLDSGLIGDLVLFENAFTSSIDMSRRWNSSPEISGGGVLIDNGTHSLDIARFLLGPIADVRVVEGLRTQSLEVEETVAIFLRSESGAIGNIDLSWTIHKPLDYFIRLHGSKGLISVGWGESKYKLTGEDWVVFGEGYDKVGAFRNQLENFAGALLGEEELRITADDGVASVRAIEAAYEALHSDPWVPVARA